MSNPILPRITFLNDNYYSDKESEDRVLILHIESKTILEAVPISEQEIKDKLVETYRFNYKHLDNYVEEFLFIVHDTLYESKELDKIFQECKEWYLNHLFWEDYNLEGYFRNYIKALFC